MTIKHSKIGASSAHRWMNCPGSVKLCDGVTQKASEYAEEGTAAHALAETCLREGCDAQEYNNKTIEGYVVESEMSDAVQIYLDTVRGDLEPDDELDVEVGISLDAIHTGMFGTVDARAYRPATQLLRIYDYKHGAGVPVEVTDNPQLLYYALGAAYRLGNRGISEVEVVIVQPRCPHGDGPVRRWRVTILELMDFGEDLLKAARLTEHPLAPLNAGEWCRWCPAAGICPKLAQTADDAAEKFFSDTVPYDPTELAETLEKVSIIKKWLKSVERFAYSEMCAGRKIPGWKLVMKRGKRKFRSDTDAAIELQCYGMDEDDIYEPRKLKSVPEIEKILKKDKQILKEMIVTESSGHTIAPLKDRRSEVTPIDAAAYFTAVENDEESED